MAFLRFAQYKTYVIFPYHIFSMIRYGKNDENRLFLMAVGPLFAVFRFLHGRTATVSTGNVFLFLGFGLHFAVVGLLASAASKTDAVFQYRLEVVCFSHSQVLFIPLPEGRG